MFLNTRISSFEWYNYYNLKIIIIISGTEVVRTDYIVSVLKIQKYVAIRNLII